MFNINSRNSCRNVFKVVKQILTLVRILLYKSVVYVKENIEIFDKYKRYGGL